MSVISRVLLIVMCFLLVICLFVVLQDKDMPFLDTVFEDVSSFEPISNDWVNVIHWDLQVPDNQILQGFVDFINRFVLTPVKTILFISTAILNGLIYVVRIIQLYFV